jgi:alkylation response protein AidB-like acyl-CoA dehydrogenase
MKRLKQIWEGLGHPLDYFGLGALVGEDDRVVLRRVEQFCQEELHSEGFMNYYRKAEFPYYLLLKINELGITGFFVPEPYGKERSLLLQGLIIATVASHDLGMSTSLFLQLPLSARTLSLLGS